MNIIIVRSEYSQDEALKMLEAAETLRLNYNFSRVNTDKGNTTSIWQIEILPDQLEGSRRMTNDQSEN